ncbi:hypothetical protein [Colwellia hornerae]|uniref:Uncharacterized protein n=1 Tax=Colwellia hornerae TaxID=89402 RepID=A0A5C6Q3B9_9GAMM|nr:hypothetical protein [Colwellia hornerae]TWX47206.1 hypothetical protein ESZ28_17745 [Colwellia hornerae]TWX54508.1 hypothetical protein ESZ26_17715 [Colwellia hornerae]TWX63288.1 hypothetical protein ESZ27_17300 [Colwellia hornerae]
MSCSNFPVKAEVKENHFRFENFKRDNSSTLEYVYLMCSHQKLTGWAEPKQYVSGFHDLWVKASISERYVPTSRRVAFVNFKVHLDANKSYMLNRQVVDDKVSLWIQDVDSGLSVSDVLTSDLKNPLWIVNSLRKKQCESGSV